MRLFGERVLPVSVNRSLTLCRAFVIGRGRREDFDRAVAFVSINTCRPDRERLYLTAGNAAYMAMAAYGLTQVSPVHPFVS